MHSTEHNLPELDNVAPEQRFLRDRDVARIFGMSESWVRVQRHYRRHDQPHVLAIDPVLIGTKPRYRRADVEALAKAF
jgi:hypothetical protein